MTRWLSGVEAGAIKRASFDAGTRDGSDGGGRAVGGMGWVGGRERERERERSATNGRAGSTHTHTHTHTHTQGKTPKKSLLLHTRSLLLQY